MSFEEELNTLLNQDSDGSYKILNLFPVAQIFKLQNQWSVRLIRNDTEGEFNVGINLNDAIRQAALLWLDNAKKGE